MTQTSAFHFESLVWDWPRWPPNSCCARTASITTIFSMENRM